jgi:hypothetical protein
MRLVSFRDGTTGPRLGVMHGEMIVDPDLVLNIDRARRLHFELELASQT